MAAKKKNKKKQTKSKRTAARVTRKKPAPKKPAQKKLAIKKQAPKKKLAKKTSRKNAAAKTKFVGKKTIGAKAASVLKKPVREKRQTVDAVAFSPEEPKARSGRQSGDLQGLSSVEGADSESVDDLLEEGNAFEADVVKGVEDAEGFDEREVLTHEVLEDDVPEEYLDLDKEN